MQLHWPRFIMNTTIGIPAHENRKTHILKTDEVNVNQQVMVHSQTRKGLSEMHRIVRDITSLTFCKI